jgi:hypothetical protein
MLVDAQAKTGHDGGWGGLSLAAGQNNTIFRLSTDGTPAAPKPAALGGEDHNRIALPLGALASGTSGSANFNLTYIPCGFTGMEVFETVDPQASPWIIRNGVNDEAQDGDTTFAPNGEGKIPWSAAKNGNGAVTFRAEAAVTDLTLYIPRPVAGQAPVTSFSAPEYSGTVQWERAGGEPHSGLFEKGTAYTARVTLTPGAGRVFSNPAPVSHDGAVTPPGDFTGEPRKGAVVFGPTSSDTPINTVDLSYLVPAPVAGQTPVSSFSTSRYNGTVAWTPNHSVFQPATVYNALVTLDPGAGYAFPPGENITGVHTAPGASVTVTHEYDLSLYVPLPVEGGTPVTSVETPTMNITIAWRYRGVAGPYYPDNGWAAFTGSAFAAGTLYGAAITLKAKGGYTFESHALFQYPDFLNPDGADYADDVAVHGNFGGSVLLHAHEKTPIRGYYTFYWTSGSGGPGSPNNTWTWQKSFAERKTLVSDKLRKTYNGKDLTEEEAKTERFVMVGFNDTQAAAPVSPGPAPGGPADGPRLAAVAFKRTGIPLYYDCADAPFSTAKAMLQTARDQGLTFMSVTLKERHPGTGQGGDTDLTNANSFTTGNSPAEVVIDGGGRLLSTSGTDAATISVGAGVTLTLRNIILENGYDGTSAVTVAGGGRLILEDGVLIRGSGNKGSNSGHYGGAGGGVYIAAGGTLTMRGGTISGNSADGTPLSITYPAYGGGVYVAGTFIMEGGAVSGNAVNSSAGAYGGGVYVASGGAFEMKGGTVSGNTVTGGAAQGGGVYAAGPDGSVPGGAFKKTGGTIYGGAEGDTMDGTVLKNTALSGAGVYAADGPLQRNATAGPGVYLDSGAPGINWDGFISLTSGSWATGTLAKPGQVVWYSFTAGTGGTYSLQWEDRTDQAAPPAYTGDITVSAYRSTDFAIFEDADKGYTAPQTLTLSTGEAVRVKVEGRSASDTGTYRIQYTGP